MVTVDPASGKRKAVTPEEKAHQRALAKVKRLNAKLSQVKIISNQMEAVSKKGQPISTRQVDAWVKNLRAILNIVEE